jgi:peptidoglycan/xylan/chitin deacetylase (PgdA/CDA1 family)
MRKRLESAMRPALKIVPFRFFECLEAVDLFVFYYHLVNDDLVPHVTNLYEYKRTRQFSDDLDFLLKHYSPVGLTDVIRWLKGNSSLPRKCFVLSFDDGFREIYDIVAPILLRKGIPAAFFLTSSFLDNRDFGYGNKASLLVQLIRKGLSPATEEAIKEILAGNSIFAPTLAQGILRVDYRRKEILNAIADIVQLDLASYLRVKKPYLSSPQVQELLVQGFSIGAHSLDHPYFSALPLAEQLRQTLSSVAFIRNRFGLDYGAFAFPHNDAGVSKQFFAKTQESGFVDITFGTGGMRRGDSPAHRQRISLEKPLWPARELIARQYLRNLRDRFRRI